MVQAFVKGGRRGREANYQLFSFDALISAKGELFECVESLQPLLGQAIGISWKEQKVCASGEQGVDFGDGGLVKGRGIADEKGFAVAWVGGEETAPVGFAWLNDGGGVSTRGQGVLEEEGV